MKNHIKLVSSIIPLIFLSCNKKENKKQDIDLENISVTHNMPPNDSIYDIANNALKKGDTILYKKAYRYFSVSHHEKEFLYYSVTMAHTYNYGRAYFDTYTILSNVNYENKLNVDNYLIQYYLLRAYEENDHYAKEDVKLKYENKKIPNSIEVLENKK